ncbi:MAG TPA: ATP-binding protein [Candidatus Competibacteraceae bacterium]|nr:ATP-binding protein [Candidatus Competibacteraceae bacterium]
MGLRLRRFWRSILPSLQARLLTGAGVVLLAFLGLTGLSLEQGFRYSALEAVEQRLQAQVYMLLGTAEPEADGSRVRLPEVLPEARLSSPLSGLYAGVLDEQGEMIWQSRSLLGLVAPTPTTPPILGEPLFTSIKDAAGNDLFLLSLRVDWETAPEQYHRFTFWVAEEPAGFNEQLASYRRSLWGWLLGSGVLLLVAQSLILRWSLQPLRRAERQVAEIQAGRRSQLSGPFPRELEALADGLNGLLRQRQQHLERYRNALGDLAHSLKTPLAVLRGALNPAGPELPEVVREQVERMNRTVDYQLQRAAASGRDFLARPLPVAPLAGKVVDALAKVYHAKGLTIALELEPGLQFQGDEGDLMEILGNLADNACKWGRRRVSLRGHREGDCWRLEVQDDGPGIPPDQRSRILERGGRADSATAGHGIGLAVVRDLVEEAYGGSLEIGDAPGGGALIRVSLPLAG